jgi:error-prone DNA polymerase
MVANVVTFRPRLAIREVGKALGFSPATIDRLAKSADSWYPEEALDAARAAQEQRPHKGHVGSH